MIGTLCVLLCTNYQLTVTIEPLNVVAVINDCSAREMKFTFHESWWVENLSLLMLKEGANTCRHLVRIVHIQVKLVTYQLFLQKYMSCTSYLVISLHF